MGSLSTNHVTSDLNVVTHGHSVVAGGDSCTGSSAGVYISTVDISFNIEVASSLGIFAVSDRDGIAGSSSTGFRKIFST